MDIWRRGLDQGQSRPLEEPRTGLVGSPLPRYEEADGPGRPGALAEPIRAAAPCWGDRALTKFLKELADGAGPRPRLQGSPEGPLGLRAQTPALSFIYLNSSGMLGTSSCNRKPLPHQFS